MANAQRGQAGFFAQVQHAVLEPRRFVRPLDTEWYFIVATR